MKEQVVLVMALLVHSTQGGGQFYSARSCSTFEPVRPEIEGTTNELRVMFEPSTYVVEAGSTVTLSISSSFDTFSNVFLRTVCETCDHKYDPIGQFVQGVPELNLYDCDGNNASAATAKKYYDNDLVVMRWVSRPDVNEKFHFAGSLMLNSSHWYSGYKSDTFTLGDSSTTSTCISASDTLRTDAVLICIVITAMIFN